MGNSGKQASDIEAHDNYLMGDAQIPGGKFILGSTIAQGFVFDNERLAHEVEIAPFAVSKDRR